MTDGNALKNKIKENGLKIVFIAEKMGCSRNRIYSILEGDDCTASEIIKLSEILRLKKNERDNIFLTSNVN